ncbi:MAG: DUF3168 domain-containing protein [Pseudomonadota bacterium]
MSIEIEVANLLQADAGVAAIAPTINMEFVHEQNATGPQIVITRVSGNIEPELDPANPWRRARLQIDCYDDDYRKTKALAAAVESGFWAYQGPAGSYQIDNVSLDNVSDLSERDSDKIDRRVSLDFLVLYQ